MTVAELEMDSVLPDELDLFELEAVRNMDRENDALARHLILAGSAGTKAAKQRGEMARLMTVCPQDLNLAGAQFLDFGWSCGIRSHAYSTSSTGSVANDRILTCAATFRLISRSVFALAESGFEMTIGEPASDC